MRRNLLEDSHGAHQGEYEDDRNQFISQMNKAQNQENMTLPEGDSNVDISIDDVKVNQNAVNLSLANFKNSQQLPSELPDSDLQTVIQKSQNTAAQADQIAPVVQQVENSDLYDEDEKAMLYPQSANNLKAPHHETGSQKQRINQVNLEMNTEQLSKSKEPQQISSSQFNLVTPEMDKQIKKQSQQQSSFDQIEEFENELSNQDVLDITKSREKDLPKAKRKLGPSKRDSIFKKELAIQKKQTLRASMHQKSDYTKYKKVNEGIKFLKLAANKMFSQSEDDLGKEEPESSAPNYLKYLRLFIILSTAFYVFFAIVYEAFLKISDVKAKNTSVETKNILSFNLTKYTADELLPFHWFMELNQQDVVDRMECLINKDTERCFEMQVQVCRSKFEVKSKKYQDCIMRAYKRYSKDKREFCQDLYYDSETYFPAERTTQQFLYDYHECLLAAGVPRGKQYCDDIYGNDGLELYICYENHGISKAIFIEDQCYAEATPTIPQKSCIDKELRDLFYLDCNFYNQWPVFCGGVFDTELKSLDQCCICNGGYQFYPNQTQEANNAMINSQSQYTECLTKNGFEDIADRFECDMQNTTYDQYQFRDQCWDDENNWVESDSYCQTTLALIKQRLECYENTLSDTVTGINQEVSGFLYSIAVLFLHF